MAMIGIQLATLTKYPPVFIDEPWFSNASGTWLTSGVNFDAIHAGALDQFGYEWVMRLCVGQLPWLICFKAFGLGFFQARLTSWFFGCCLLLATWHVGTRLYGRLTGALAIFLLSASPAFIQASHYARQDIMLAFVGMLVFGLSRYALLKISWWGHLLVGLLAGGSIDIHQNGCVYVVVVYPLNH